MTAPTRLMDVLAYFLFVIGAGYSNWGMMLGALGLAGWSGWVCGTRDGLKDP